MARRRAQTDAFNLLRHWQAPRRRPAPAPHSPQTPPAAADNKPANPPETAENDHALWQAATQGVKALAKNTRAEITPPPPPLRVRPKTTPVDTAAKKRPTPDANKLAASGRDADLLRTAFADVKPLPASDGHALSRQAAPQKSNAPPPDENAEDEKTLFARLMGDIQPLRGNDRVHLQAPPASPQPRQRLLDDAAALQESLAPLDLYDKLEAGVDSAFIRPGIAQRTLKDLRRGRWVIQAELDLHGLNRDDARAALAVFLADCLAQGKRCLRVIHGKGLGSPGGHSILKALSWHWLAQRREILAFCQAAPRQGGAGALIVLLGSSVSKSGEHSDSEQKHSRPTASKRQ